MTLWIGDPECIEMMQAVDAMPAVWRALVHEYGGLIVRQLYDDGHDAQMAEVLPAQRRELKQRQWLATDFITPRMRQSFEART